jgi:deoxyribonuclease V
MALTDDNPARPEAAIRPLPDRRHPWDIPPAEARILQQRLAQYPVLENRLERVRAVAGIDVGFPGGMARAAVAVLDYPDLTLVESAVAVRPVTMPYVPGLLSFREGPAILDALARLKSVPDLLIFDGQGIAHPRRLGIAAHIGVITDMPAIGCAKSRLCGAHAEPGIDKGAHAPLIHEGEEIGRVLRTRRGVKPLFVSPGHRMDMAGSIQWVLNCCRRYKLPETTRWAHRLAGGTVPGR